MPRIRENVDRESGTARLLVLSQVILSLQLSFAVFPLVMFTCDRHKMGEFVNTTWVKGLAWTTAVFIAALTRGSGANRPRVDRMDAMAISLEDSSADG